MLPPATTARFRVTIGDRPLAMHGISGLSLGPPGDVPAAARDALRRARDERRRDSDEGGGDEGDGDGLADATRAFADFLFGGLFSAVRAVTGAAGARDEDDPLGDARPGTVTLHRVVDGDTTLSDWLAMADPDLRDVLVELVVDVRDQDAVARWSLLGALPRRWHAPPLDAGSDEAVAVERLELAYADLTVTGD